MKWVWQETTGLWWKLFLSDGLKTYIISILWPQLSKHPPGPGAGHLQLEEDFKELKGGSPVRGRGPSADPEQPSNICCCLPSSHTNHSQVRGHPTGTRQWLITCQWFKTLSMLWTFFLPPSSSVHLQNPHPSHRFIKAVILKILFSSSWLGLALGHPWWSRNHEARGDQSLHCDLPQGTLFQITFNCSASTWPG